MKRLFLAAMTAVALFVVAPANAAPPVVGEKARSVFFCKSPNSVRLLAKYMEKTASGLMPSVLRAVLARDCKNFGFRVAFDVAGVESLGVDAEGDPMYLVSMTNGRGLSLYTIVWDMEGTDT